MTTREEQPQAIVNASVVAPVSLRRGRERGELLHLALAHDLAAKDVVGAVSSRNLEPARAIGGYAVARPVLQRSVKGVLCTILGEIPITRHSNDVGDDSAPLAVEGLDDSELGGRHLSQIGLTSTAP